MFHFGEPRRGAYNCRSPWSAKCYDCRPSLAGSEVGKRPKLRHASFQSADRVVQPDCPALAFSYMPVECLYVLS